MDEILNLIESVSEGFPSYSSLSSQEALTILLQNSNYIAAKFYKKTGFKSNF